MSAGQDPHVIVVDMRERPPVSSLEAIAFCVAIVRLIQEERDAHPDVVERILFGAWRQVTNKLLGLPADRHSVPLLGEYFRHAGDWGSMRRCLISSGEKMQTAHGEFAALCDKSIERARKEYAEYLAESPETRQ